MKEILSLQEIIIYLSIKAHSTRALGILVFFTINSFPLYNKEEAICYPVTTPTLGNLSSIFEAPWQVLKFSVKSFPADTPPK